MLQFAIPGFLNKFVTHQGGRPISIVNLAEVRVTIERLRRVTTASTVPERARVNQMKRYLNFIALGVDSAGAFLNDMRHAQTEAELFGTSDRYLLSQPDQEFALEPYRGIVARLTCESVNEPVTS